MRKMVLVAVVASMSLATVPRLRAETCVCRIEDGAVSVKNFPELQVVSIAKSNALIDVKENDLSRAYHATLDLGTGEKKPVGPFPLDGRRRASIQIAQIFPRQGAPPALVLKWYVRFHQEDAFFDPCLLEKDRAGKEPHECSTGFPPTGARLRPLMPPSLADRLEEFYIAPAPSGIATLEVEGTEALLVVENAGSGPRTVRVNVLLER